MTSFVLIPGADGPAWYWHRVVPLLREAGHEAIAVDLPGDDETAGLPEYTSLVTGAIGGRDDVVLVAPSLGGFTASLAAARPGVCALVFVNAMIPVPGETPGAWWGNTGWEQARIDAALTAAAVGLLAAGAAGGALPGGFRPCCATSPGSPASACCAQRCSAGSWPGPGPWPTWCSPRPRWPGA